MVSLQGKNFEIHLIFALVTKTFDGSESNVFKSALSPLKLSFQTL